jgi:O-antigen/teichoic acid export membrane protein
VTGASAKGRREHGLGRRITTNASVQAIGVVGGSAISLITFAVITRVLGPSGFGDFAAAIAYLAVPTLVIDTGLSGAVVREMSRFPDRIQQILQLTLPLRAAVSAPLILLAVGLAQVLPFSAGARTAIAIGAVGALVTLLGGGVATVLRAELRMAWSVAASIAGRTATLLLTLGAVWLDLGLEGVAWAYSLGSVVTAAMQFEVVSRRYSIRPVVDLRDWRRQAREGAALSAVAGLGLVYWRIDTVIIALLRSSREVGLYAAAYRFIDLASAFVSGVYNSIFPPLAQFIANRDPRARRLVQQAFDVLVAFATPGTVLALIYPEEIVTLVAGAEFQDAATALRILALVPLLTFSTVLLENGLVAGGRENVLLWMIPGILVLNVALNVAFVPVYGYTAAAVVTLTTEALWLVAAVIVFRRVFGFLPVAGGLGAVLASAAIMAVVAMALPAPAIVSASASLMVYATLVVVMPGSVHRLLWPHLGPRLRRFRADETGQP